MTGIYPCSLQCRPASSFNLIKTEKMTEENLNTEQPVDVARTEVTETHVKSDPIVVKRSNLLPTILSILSLLGVIVLLAVQFGGSSKTGENVAAAVNRSEKSVKVAFVNYDSIVANYELIKKLRTEFEAKTKRLDNDINAKQREIEKGAAYLEEQVNKKSLSEQSAQEVYVQLQQEQQKVLELRDRYLNELQMSELQMQETSLDSIINFIGRYNKQYKFDYILGFTKTGNILYANDTLDITKDVIQQLNVEYNAKHAKK